ncbi:hypothetical protein LP414_19795 [Polaromonas sp. P1(28)-13]|nr:hypothetical protein LP414_19795 [Polaromonas sp. P1(28)-13]
MSPLDAQKIIDALASGIDPETGEVVSDDSPLNNPHVIRALFLASKALSATIRRIESNDGRPGKAGKPWSDAEDKQLLQAFDSGTSIQELTNQHERSVGGISSRLVRLGRIKERSEVRERLA